MMPAVDITLAPGKSPDSSDQTISVDRMITTDKSAHVNKEITMITTSRLATIVALKPTRHHRGTSGGRTSHCARRFR
jgi:hypothetical protein